MRLQSPAPAQAHFSSTRSLHPQRGHATTYTRNRSSPAPSQGIRSPDFAHHHSRGTRERSFQSSWSPQHQGAPASRGRRDAGRIVAASNTDRTSAPIAGHRTTISRPHDPRRRSRSPDHARPPPATNYRLRSPDYVRRPGPRADRFHRSPHPGPRERFRDHEAVHPVKTFDTASSYSRQRAFTERSGPPNPRYSPPYQQHRLWSRSRSPLAHQYNRPRLESSPRRIYREPYTARSPGWSNHSDLSLHQRRNSSRRRESRSKISERRASPLSSARPEPGPFDNPNTVPLGHRPSSRLAAGTSPLPNPRCVPTSSQRRTSSPLHGGQESSIQRSFCEEVSEPKLGGAGYEHRQVAPRSPRLRSGSRPRESEQPFPSKARGTSDLRQYREGPIEAATGANSIEVDMSARGNFRGAYGGQYPPRGGHFNHGPNDQRNFSHPASGSPPAQSPYASGRGNWAGQRQASPQNQFAPQFPSNGYAPTGPAAHLQASPANAPPAGTPTGPSAQFATGRGYRGSSGGYRGNAGGRGGPRGGFKSGHWGSGNGSRAASSQPDDLSSGRATPRATSNAGDSAGSSHGDARASTTQDADNPFRPPKELQVEDIGNGEKTDAKPMLPPTSRPPPTGPAAEKKISFALKLAPKAPVATPKLEISAKFSAPAKKDPAKESSRHDPRDSRDSRDSRDGRDGRDGRDPRDRRDSRDARIGRDTRDHGPSRHPADLRDLPRNVPTEPRAAKAAVQQRQHRQEHRQEPRPEPPKEQPPREPRVRIVKKKMKRPKPRPSLPDDLIGSDSVYFRKPGNESVIGAGTYGKVFKALHVYTKNLVALKRIRMEGERDGFPVTAVREIKLLQSLKHINVVALLEVMVEKNECYMVFEYMSHDLTGLLNHPTFTLNAAHRKHLSMQLFEGLDYLHKRGVLHRDIKAANILVSNEGILKLADFGLARFYAKRHQLDYTNRVVTIWYRSPELLLGETQYGPAVDIWSAACVMVEVFTRKAIFAGDGGEISQLDKIYSVLGTPHRSEWPGLIDMPWFELMRPGVRKPNVFEELYKDRLSTEAYDLLLQMLRYDPAKRPTAAQVLEHAYFTAEAPAPKQVIELQEIEGDWHEFESKALRRENERKDKEARKAAEKSAAASSSSVKDPKKRPPETSDAQRESKRQHVEEKEPSQQP